MYASIQRQEASSSTLFRHCGRAGGLIIVAGWLTLVIVEFFRSGPPVIENYYQGAMLAIVFVGYAVGWRKEALGGALGDFGNNWLCRIKCCNVCLLADFWCGRICRPRRVLSSR